MNSRRIATSEKTLLDRDDGAVAVSASSDGSIAPAVPASVIVKLLGFTLAMIALPIGSYFLTVNTIFRGNSTLAGGLAAVMANVVLIAYVVVAFKEDQTERLEAESKEKKSR
ncbi:VMA21-like domain-containing protein [Phyllosticta citrichinensis]|uniref:VMA21-like domain-containing protein n=1 Tax=Phyllosticta citrichinensis TaxID=1130410 RepID=A0ABR1XR57_9PEZI